MAVIDVFLGFSGVGFTVLEKDENSFEMAGITYHATPTKTCIGCAFEFSDMCLYDSDQPYCMASMRQDGKDVIWQRENRKIE